MPSADKVSKKVLVNADAWQYKQTGLLPQTLALVKDLPIPEPKDNEVLVKITHAALNPVDWKLAKFVPSRIQKLPRTAGSDFAGEIVSVGGAEGAQAATRPWLKPGQRVYGLVGADEGVRSGRGTLSTHTLVSTATLNPTPDNVKDEDVAGLSLVGMTALTQVNYVKPGDRVFVVGGTTAVGLLAADLARWKGASYVAASASGQKVDFLKQRGVDYVVDYRANDVPTELTKQFKDQPFDAILDCVGSSDVYTKSVPYLKPSGVYVNIGASMLSGEGSLLSAETRGMMGFLLKASLLPSWAGGVPRKFLNKGLDKATCPELGRALDAGAVKPVVDRSFAWSEVPQAYEYLMQGRALGKILVKVGDN